jgi:hypothetical protein
VFTEEQRKQMESLNKKWYEENKDKRLTITFSYEDWYSIWREAEGHLSYWGADNESVDKLREILDKFENNLK